MYSKEIHRISIFLFRALILIASNAVLRTEIAFEPGSSSLAYKGC